jgi:hypothetical protein
MMRAVARVAGPVVWAWVICAVFGLPSILFTAVAGFLVLRATVEACKPPLTIRRVKLPTRDRVPGSPLGGTRLLTPREVEQIREAWRAKQPKLQEPPAAPRVCSHGQVEEIRSCVTGALVALWCPVCDRQSTCHNVILAKSLAPDPGMVTMYVAAWARLLNRERGRVEALTRGQT